MHTQLDITQIEDISHLFNIKIVFLFFLCIDNKHTWLIAGITFAFVFLVVVITLVVFILR